MKRLPTLTERFRQERAKGLLLGLVPGAAIGTYVTEIVRSSPVPLWAQATLLLLIVACWYAFRELVLSREVGR